MESNNVIVSEDMDAYEVFMKLKDMVSLKKYEKGYYIDYLIGCKSYSKKEAEIIYDFVRDVWETTDAKLSMDSLIETMDQLLENKLLSITNIHSINKYKLLELTDDQELKIDEMMDGMEL